MTESTKKLWRTLVRVVGLQRGGIWLCVPGWNSEIAVLRPLSIFPGNAQNFMEAGYRFFAQVNIGAETPDELIFEDFEDPEPI